MAAAKRPNLDGAACRYRYSPNDDQGSCGELTAVQVPFSELLRWTSVPPLDEYDLEQMSVDEVELLLQIRLRAFVARGHGWQQALALALTPDAP